MKTKRITMIAVSLALFMDVMDSNVINTAVPAMSHTFSVSPIDLKIALISYLLSLAIFIPISGWVADRYGAKNIFIAAIGLFTATSFFCGYSHTLMQLIIARSIQGIGGAFMISLGRLMIAKTFPRHEMVEAMNFIIIIVSFAVMIGPFVGGVIVDHLSWPWIFWINIPAGIFLIALSVYGLKEVVIKNIRPFDAVGFILFGGSLALSCFSLSEISETNSDVFACLVHLGIGLTLLFAYVLYAKRKKHPVMKIDLFRIRTFRVSVIGNLCARLGFGGMPFLIPLMLQVALGFSAQLAGLLMVPIAFGIMTSKVIASKILRALGYRRYLLSNTVIVSLILCSFQWITQNTSVYVIGLMCFIFGVFISVQYTGMNSLALADIQDDELSASTSITSTVQVLAQSLGVAFGAILLRIFLSLSKPPAHLSIAIFHKSFLALGVITLFSMFVFMQLHERDGEKMLKKVL